MSPKDILWYYPGEQTLNSNYYQNEVVKLTLFRISKAHKKQKKWSKPIRKDIKPNLIRLNPLTAKSTKYYQVINGKINE